MAVSVIAESLGSANADPADQKAEGEIVNADAPKSLPDRFIASLGAIDLDYVSKSFPVLSGQRLALLGYPEAAKFGPLILAAKQAIKASL